MPNQIVSIDLKQYDAKDKDKKWICYLVDMFSRLTVGAFIPNKKPQTIVQVILENWIGTALGKMDTLHSDNGGEFSNSLMEEVAAMLDMKLTTTSAYSPHQNGICEKNHAIVDLMMTRMMASDPKLTPEMALRWSLHAKNSLENAYGYTPFQLHTGRNPILPSATRDGPAALEDSSRCKVFAENINAMHMARREFIKAEGSSF